MKSIAKAVSDYRTLIQFCDLERLWDYIKSNIIRAPLEAAITIYLAEVVLLLTPFFGSFESPATIVVMIVLPVCVSVLVYLIYSLIVAIRVKSKAIELASSLEEEKSIDYDELDDGFRIFFYKVHVFGSLCYVVLSIIFAVWLGCYVLDSPNLLHLFGLAILFSFFGIGWNIYGYYSDMRINWNHIFYNVDPPGERLIEKKYRAFRLSLIVQICMLCLVAAVIGYASFRSNLHGDLFSYAVIPSIFVTVFSVYITQTYKRFFKPYKKSSKTEQSSSYSLFFSPFDIGKKLEDNKEE